MGLGSRHRRVWDGVRVLDFFQLDWDATGDGEESEGWGWIVAIGMRRRSVSKGGGLVMEEVGILWLSMVWKSFELTQRDREPVLFISFHARLWWWWNRLENQGEKDGSGGSAGVANPGVEGLFRFC